MRTRDFLLRLPIVTRVALALAIATLTVPFPAGAAPSGADLGPTSGLKILDGTTCGQYMMTAALDSKCDSASANHWIILGWNFSPDQCSEKPCAKPDGFNIVRAAGGARAVFATQTASPSQTTVFGTVLENIKGDENIGACFSVVPYRGTNDLGRASNEVCIDQVVHLGPTRWGTSHAYADHSNSSSCGSPSANSIGYKLMFENGGANSGKTLFAGYVMRANNSGCNYYVDAYQGLVYYDLSKLAGKSVSKATLRLQIVAGAYNAGVPISNNGSNDGNQQAVDKNCATSIGYPTNVSVDNDPVFPPTVTYDRFASLPGGIGEVDVDVTEMVRAWLHPGGVNRGLVLSSQYDAAQLANDVHSSNAACLSQYREPVLDLDVQ